MKVPISWLKEIIELDLDLEEIANTLTMIGLEVEAIEKFKPFFEGVVVGKVVSCEKHPNADSLKVAKVTDGSEVYQVVCGAPNCREGLKTAFCRVGGTLKDEEGNTFSIKKAKLRGIESFGMLCSGSELQVSSVSEGIIELPEFLQEGSDLCDFFSEDILDVAFTPNLGFAASMVGIARELSAVLETPYHPPVFRLEESGPPLKDLVSVTVDDPEKCPRYACRVIEDVKVKPSPHWLQNKLLHLGLRPINNVADITNFVLYEMGHPLHAFDLDQIKNSNLVIRSSTKGEGLKTLDGKSRTLQEGFLVIADESCPLALAGVMGGEDSEVTEKTTRVLIEKAYFDPPIIRKASKFYNLSTDASWRFERGCDPNNVLFALDRAVSLIQEICGGKVATGVIDWKEKEFLPTLITVRVKKANDVLGILLSPGEVESVFKKLGFVVNYKEPEVLEVEVPTYRVDISGEIDLIEEIARIYGYNNIPCRPSSYKTSEEPHAPIYVFEKEVSNRLVAEGLQEFLTCDLISPSQVKLVEDGTIPPEIVIKVQNPTSIEQSILRPSLLPGLLQVVKYNRDRQVHDISGFEMGRIHFKQEERYKEQSVAGIILTGCIRPHHFEEKVRKIDFFDLKGMIENVFRSLNTERVVYEKSAFGLFHPGRQATIHAGDVRIGSLGELHPKLTREMDIDERVFYAEFNLHDLMGICKESRKMKELPLFPASSRDWTVTVLEEMEIKEFFNAVSKLDSQLIEDVLLLDIYRSDRIGTEGKNVTFRFVYRDRKKTIAQEEVDTEHAIVTENVLKILGKAVI